jgi:hypothetical protein
METIRGKLSIPTYSCHMWFIVTPDMCREMTRIYRKHGVAESFSDAMEGCMFSPSIDILYVVIDIQYLTHNTISHELYHVVNALLGQREIHNEESSAWLTGHVSEFVYRFLKKKNIEVKHG